MPQGAMTKSKKKHLKYVGLQPRTLRAYRQALDSFLQFLQRTSLNTMRPSHLDRSLAEFINIAYQEGEPIAYSGHLLSAIKRFHPELRLKIPVASQYYRNWSKAYVPVRALPASWELVEAMIGVALHANQARLALLLGLSFHAMLRTSEMMALTKDHLLFHQQHQSLSVIIPTSKTSQGNPQVLQVTDPVLASMAQLSLRSLKRGRKLWAHGPHAFRRRFQQLLQKLGFQPHSYYPYSLRRGGATWWYNTTLSLDSTVMRGRWANQKTCRIYVDTGTMQLAHLNWTRKQVRLIRRWRQKGAKLRLRQCQKGLGLD